jgi:hypothetical protein
MIPMKLFIEILGWIGSVEILLAYGLNSYQRIRSDSLVFYLLNFSGGIFLIVYSIQKEAFANTFINAVWVIIAVVAMMKFFKTGKQP